MKRTSLVPKLGKEQLLLAANLSNAEIRFIVADYYAVQEARKRADMQLRHIGDKTEQANASLLQYAATTNALVEKEIIKALDKYAQATRVGRWCMSNIGVGPVITAGLQAYLGGTDVPDTVGHWWRFAGLDPSVKWEKGQKRPYNAALKQLTFQLGECIKRTCNHPDNDVYGRLYKEQKVKLVARNEAGGFADKAATYRTHSAEAKAVCKTGKVPAGYLDRMACRFVAKIFLSHMHALSYWDVHGKSPAKPFAIAILGHAHEIVVPNSEGEFPGFAAAYYGTPAAMQEGKPVEVSKPKRKVKKTGDTERGRGAGI